MIEASDDPIFRPLFSDLRRALGLRLDVRAGARRGSWSEGSPGDGALRLIVDRRDSPHGDQWYRVQVRPDSIRIAASTDAGFRYAGLTLSQLLSAGKPWIRAMDLEDWPDFPVRGVMLDISRDKVPKLSTLRGLVELLAGWRINQLQLYMEHTFAYAGHEEVWRGASPLDGGEIRELDAYCRERGVELVPNQNSLGHMERWLRHRSYAHLAECSGSWTTPWGEVRHRPATLNPLDPGSIRLVAGLYDQLLPHFSSRLLNVGCDEPFELGQGRSRRACDQRGPGRVYLDYLLKLRRAAARHGRRIMFWGDWIERYPALVDELPGDATALVWGYEADSSFGASCRRLKAAGLPFYVCPGTSSWCSIAGRTTNCLGNLRNAALAGRRHGAEGYLITDWGDFGHRQYLPVSYPGFLYGAALSWCLGANQSINVGEELSRWVYEDPTGQVGKLWMEAGRIHELSGVALKNRSLPFACLQSPLADTSVVGRLSAARAQRMAHRARALKTCSASLRSGGADGALAKEELEATLEVLHHACRRAELQLARRTGRRPTRHLRWFIGDVRRIIDRHAALWLQRNRRGGLASSLSHYRRNLREYETALS